MPWEEHFRGPTRIVISADGRNVYVLAVEHFGRQLEHSSGGPGICLGRSAGCLTARGLRSIRWSINGRGEREQLFESRDRRFLYVLGSSVAAFRIG